MCEHCLIWALKKSILFGNNYLKGSVLNDINSGKVCSIVCQQLSENVSIVWCQEKCVVLFGSNSLKVIVMFDMNSENVFTLVW